MTEALHKFVFMRIADRAFWFGSLAVFASSKANGESKFRDAIGNLAHSATGAGARTMPFATDVGTTTCRLRRHYSIRLSGDVGDGVDSCLAREKHRTGSPEPAHTSNRVESNPLGRDEKVHAPHPVAALTTGYANAGALSWGCVRLPARANRRRLNGVFGAASREGPHAMCDRSQHIDPLVCLIPDRTRNARFLGHK